MKKSLITLSLLCSLALPVSCYAYTDSVTEPRPPITGKERDILYPVGTVLVMPEKVPSGHVGYAGTWKLCDGSRLKKSDYRTLYNIIGDRYDPDNSAVLKNNGTADEINRRTGGGSGGGITSSLYFHLPDFRGNFAQNRDPSNSNEAPVGIVQASNNISTKDTSGKGRSGTFHATEGFDGFNATRGTSDAHLSQVSATSGDYYAMGTGRIESFTAKKLTTAGRVIEGILSLGFNELMQKMKKFDIGAEYQYTFSDTIGDATKMAGAYDYNNPTRTKLVMENQACYYYIRVK